MKIVASGKETVMTNSDLVLTEINSSLIILKTAILRN